MQWLSALQCLVSRTSIFLVFLLIYRYSAFHLVHLFLGLSLLVFRSSYCKRIPSFELYFLSLLSSSGTLRFKYRRRGSLHFIECAAHFSCYTMRGPL